MNTTTPEGAGEFPPLPKPIAQIGKFLDDSTDVFDGSQMHAFAEDTIALRAQAAEGEPSAPEAAPAKQEGEATAIDCYDAGLLNDFGGGNVDWWQDYIRAELGRAHDFYESQFASHAHAAPAPVNVVIHCPKCGKQHIDVSDAKECAWPQCSCADQVDRGCIAQDVSWTNPPHRSHLCHGCGHIWRPADVPTNGVQAVKTEGKADSPIAAPAPASEAVAQTEALEKIASLLSSMFASSRAHVRGPDEEVVGYTVRNGALHKIVGILVGLGHRVIIPANLPTAHEHPLGFLLGVKDAAPTGSESGDAVDARRYRWLRNESHPDREDTGLSVSEQDFNSWGKPFNRFYSGEALDAAIDGALQDVTPQEGASHG